MQEGKLEYMIAFWFLPNQICVQFPVLNKAWMLSKIQATKTLNTNLKCYKCSKLQNLLAIELMYSLKWPKFTK